MLDTHIATIVIYLRQYQKIEDRPLTLIFGLITISDMADFALDNLIDFLERSGSKGWLNASTAKALISACNRVFRVLEEAEKADVREIDIDDAIRRFHNTDGGVSDSSLATYKSRIQRAIDLYTQYRTNPTGWRAAVPTKRSSKKSGAGGGDGSGQRAEKSGSHRKSRFPSPDTGVDDSDLFTYPFPLRDGVTVQISNLPRDLTIAESERLTAFLRALSVDSSKNPRSGSGDGG